MVGFTQGYPAFTNGDFDIIKKYLILRDREQLANTLSPGYCHGLALFFCYCAANKKINQFSQFLKDIGTWQEDEELINKIKTMREKPEWKTANKKIQEMLAQQLTIQNEAFLNQVTKAKQKNILSQNEADLLLGANIPEDTNIEKLINLVEWLQRPGKYFNLKVDSISTLEFIRDAKDDLVAFNETSDFEAAILVPKSDLANIFSRLPQDRAIELGTGRHAMSLYFDGTDYIYYDSNIKSDELPRFHDPQKLAEHVINTTYGGLVGTHIPLSIAIFSLQNQNAHDYTSLNELCDQYTKIGDAEQIYTDPTSLSDYPTDGITPLILAINANLPNATHQLLQRYNKAEAALTDKIGFAPIHYASFNGMHNIVSQLLKNGVSVDQPTQPPPINRLNSTSQFYYESINGVTPLYFACYTNDIEMVNLLLSAGANINAASKTGMTPLGIAAMKGYKEIVAVLIKKGAKLDTLVHNSKDVPLSSKSNLTALLPLEYFGAIYTPAYEGHNAAMLAAHENHAEIVTQLLDSGIEINDKNRYGITLLCKAVFNDNLTLTKELLNRKADINILFQLYPHSPLLGSPLYLACYKGNAAMVQLLLEQGAKVNLNNPNEQSVLLVGIKSGSLEVIKLLLRQDPDIDPAIIDDENIKIIIAKEDHTVSVTHILIRLHKADPGLINDESRKILTDCPDCHIEYIDEALTTLYETDHNLINDKNFRLITNMSNISNIDMITKCLTLLHKVDPKLINDDTRDFLGKKSYIKYLFTILSEIAPELLTQDNIKLMNEHLESSSTFDICGGVYRLNDVDPKLVSDINFKGMIKNTVNLDKYIAGLIIEYQGNKKETKMVAVSKTGIFSTMQQTDSKTNEKKDADASNKKIVETQLAKDANTYTKKQP